MTNKQQIEKKMNEKVAQVRRELLTQGEAIEYVSAYLDAFADMGMITAEERRTYSIKTYKEILG